MGVLHLVRHGQASAEGSDYDVLSPTGHEQARVVGAALAGLDPDLVVHGSLRRQVATAEELVGAAGWAGITLETDPAWNELDHLDLLARVDAVPDEPFQAWFERATDRYTSGDHDDYAETYLAFTSRVLTALDLLADRGTVVVVTSGGPIAVVVTALLRADVPTYRAVAPVVVNTSITRVASGRRGLSLLTFNEHAHLPRHLLTYR